MRGAPLSRKPFRDSIAEGVSHQFWPCFHRDRASTAEIPLPFCGGGEVGARNGYHLSFWRFSPLFYNKFWPNLNPIHVVRQIVVL